MWIVAGLVIVGVIGGIVTRLRPPAKGVQNAATRRVQRRSQRVLGGR